MSFVLCTQQAFAVLDPPELHCASVQPNGDVDLTWTPPIDPNNEFDHYEVYQAAVLGGPYSLVGNIGVLAQNTFVHAGANAFTGAKHYYIITVSQGPPPNLSVESDTLSTLFLNVNQSAPLGSAVLDWTPQHTPPLSTADDHYDIWMEYPIGTWTIIDTTVLSLMYYQEVISICEDSLTFRVSLTNMQGCISFSNLDGDVFEDDTPPTSPPMITVTVDTLTGLSVLNWQASPEGDTDGYIIVLVTNLGSVVVDTVYGQFNTSFLNPTSTPGNGVESYTIAAIDSCWSGTPPSPNTSATLDPHSTIHLTTNYDRCNAQINVNWTDYVGWDAGVVTYQLYVQRNGNAPQLLGNLNGNVNTFTHQQVIPFNTYCYFVKAIGVGAADLSFSNRSCIITDYPDVPTFNYIRTATVEALDHVSIVARVDQGAVAKRYRLQRAQNDGPFQQIASQGPTTNADIFFNDLDVETDRFSYRYKVLVEDSCGQVAVTSNEGVTMWLRATAGLDGINRLNWNGYEEWDGQVIGYQVLRSIDGAPYQSLATNPATLWEFEDDVNPLFTTNGNFCYAIQAIEAGNTIANDTTSLSNVACAIQEDAFYVPNAFIAGGYNNTFFPVYAFVDLTEYEFLIINRWGQIIWSTDDPQEAWDGKVNGELVPEGMYAYYFGFRNGAGKRIEKRGTVTFLHGLE